MDRQIAEVQSLATKYSKSELGRMVSMGLLDPQKAMMAGMMIDRIQKQNAQPPQTTVAEDVLNLPGMAEKQQQQPQPAGVEALPAGNVGEYAGGGIVAFADGGEADVPGFAAGIPPGLFDALIKAESGGEQSAVSNKGARGVAQLMPGTMRDPGYGIKPVRDDSESENRRVGEEYLSAMLRKYKGNIDNALAAYNWGPGNVDKHLKKYGELTPEKLPKETRAYIPRVKNFLARQEQRRTEPTRVAERPPVDDMSGGIPAGQLMRSQDRVGMPSLLRGPLEKVARLLPSAEAGGIEELPAGMQARAAYADGGVLRYAGRDGSVVGSKTNPRIFEDPLQDRIPKDNVQIFDIAPFIAGPTSTTPGAEIPKSQRTGQFGAYNVAEDQFPLQSYQEMLARRQQGVGSAEDKKPETFVPNVVEREKPEPPAPIKAEQIKVPTQKNVKDEIGQIREAYKEAGVDVDMYKNMMQELKEKKAGLGERKNQAFGFALMSVGLGLTGARRGQEFAKLGSEGQKALGTYMNSMERIVENEQQLDMLNRQLAMAENNFKRTGAETALAQVRAREERIEQVEAKNAELRQAANTAQAQVGATVYGAQLGAEVRRDIMEMQANAKVEAAKAQAGKAGALTQKQEYDIRQQMAMDLEPKLREKYKRFGSEAQINQKVKEELDKTIDAEIAKIRSRSAGYGGGAAPQDIFADWSVEGM